VVPRVCLPDGLGNEAPVAGREAAAPGLGLVVPSTSDTRSTLVASEMRVRRVRNRVGHATSLFADVGRLWPGQRVKAWFVTLTYRADRAWSPRDITAYIKAYRAWCARHGVLCRYLWVAELTQVGRVHYHIVTWLPVRLAHPKPDKKGFWPHGWSQRDVAKGMGQRAGFYCAKYISKGERQGHKYPRGCRVFGFGGLDQLGRRSMAYESSPAWFRGAVKWIGQKVRRVGSVIFSGEGADVQAVPSPWRLIGAAFGVVQVEWRGFVWA